ncbi:RNA-directed DNA polymerase [Desulfobulbus propionicus]
MAEYYSTFYTHSIPWVLHGKEFAKQHQQDDNLGNRLDRLVRNAQDRQTNGIPVGPDTSFVLGELVLATVDAQLVARMGQLSGHRHYDDYELVFETRSDAEACLIALQACLNEVGLQLNGRKTRILELPQALDEQWRDFIRHFNGIEVGRHGIHRVIAFFNGVFNAHNTWTDRHVLAYAVGRIEREAWSDDEVPTLQALLHQCATTRPEAIAPVLRVLAKFKIEDRNLDYVSLQVLLNDLVGFHSRRLNVNEVAWCVWAAIALELELSSGAAEHILQLDDPFVALLTLDAMSRGLFRGPLDTSRWKVEMTARGLYGKHWPLAYEALRRGWLPSADGTDYIANDDCYSFLRDNGAGPYVKFKELTPTILEAMRPPHVEYGNERIDDDEDEEFDLDENLF